MSTIRLHALIPSPTDGTSFYRAMGPLCALRKQIRKHTDLQINQPTGVDWSTQVDCDLMFLQRPCLGMHVKVAEITKTCRTPIWVDFDDDLLNVTLDNPTAATYGNEQIQKNIKLMLQMADVVTVSTPGIAASFQEFCPTRIRVIPNAWDDTLRPFITPPVGERNNLAIWRGSATHIRDVLEVSNAITTAAQIHSDWKFTFMGWEPWFVTEKEIEAEFYAKQEVLPYFDTLRSIAGKIMHVPLADTTFNRGKSNIAWLEASYAGCAVLAPNFPEWQRPGIRHYNGHAAFGAALESMLAESWSNLFANVCESREYIRESLLLSKVNDARMELLDGLLARRQF